MVRRLMLTTGLLLLLTIAIAANWNTKTQAQATAGLVINEIFDSSNPANEFFELYNGTTRDIDLSTYVIYNNNAFDLLSQLDNPIIRAGGFKSIGASDLDGSIGGGLLHDGDFLGLVNTGVSDEVIDVVNWGTPNPNWRYFGRFSPYFFVTAPSMPNADSTVDLQRFPDGVDTNTGADFAALTRSPNTASCDDPNEDDDSPAATSGDARRTLALNVTQIHRICSTGDVDFVRINLQTTISYTIQTSNLGTNLDTVMTLYDTNGVDVLDSANDNGPTPRSDKIVFRPPTAGTYYISVTDANGGGAPGPDWLYSLTMSGTIAATVTPTGSPAASATPTPFCDDAYEPDNNRAQARPLSLGPDSQTHTICRNGAAALGDEDWYVVTAATGKIYTIQTSDLGGGLDTLLTVYNSDGGVLVQNDDSGGLASRVDLTFPEVGAYFVRVRDNRGLGGYGWTYGITFTSEGNPPLSATPTITLTPDPNAPTVTPTLGPCSDPYEPDGTPDSAQLLLIGENEPGHTFCPAGDADWYRFFAGVGKAYTIQTANLGLGVDTYMYLFDSDGRTVIAQNDDGPGEDVTSVLDFFPLRDAFYYIMVKNKGDLGFTYMTYDLSLSVKANAGNVPVGSATPIIAPVVTVTPAPATATAQATATRTPTRTVTPGEGEATATPEGGDTPTETPEIPTAEPTGESALPPPAISGAQPTATAITVQSASPDGAPTPEPFVPLPATGDDTPAADSIAVPVTVYADSNGDGKFSPGEAVRGLALRFVDSSGATVALATTGADGVATAQLVRNSRVRLQIQYLKWSGELVAATAGLQVRLPAARLPARIP